MNTSGRITKTIRHSRGSTSAAHRASYEVTQVRYYIFSILFLSLFNAMNSSRKKKQRKTTTKMGEMHHIYIWYDGSSKQRGGGQPSISRKHFFSDVLALYNMYVLSSVRQYIAIIGEAKRAANVGYLLPHMFAATQICMG